MTSRCLVSACLSAVLLIPGAASAQAPAAGTPAAQAASPAQAPPPADQAPPSPAQARYNALVERAKNADATVDLAELREAFTETPAYRATMMGVYQALWTPLNRGDVAGALQVAEKVLESNYVEVNAHMVASVAHQQLGNVPRAQHHRSIANGLLTVIMSKGDGATPDTPWVVIDISEEYAVMRALNLSMQSQALSMKDGVSMDVLQTVDRMKQPRTLYFDVNRSMAAMSRGRAVK